MRNPIDRLVEDSIRYEKLDAARTPAEVRWDRIVIAAIVVLAAIGLMAMVANYPPGYVPTFPTATPLPGR